MEHTFDEQREVFKDYLTKAFDYVDLDEVYEARYRMYKANQILDEDMMIFMMYASYIGSLKRISYYKYVHKRGFDVRALADACVLVYMFGFAYQLEFEKYLNRKEVKTAINKTRYPVWTKMGLVGASTKDLSKYGNEFSNYMDSLENELVTA